MNYLLRFPVAALVILYSGIVFAEESGTEAFDVTQIPIEQLLETEFIPASRIARQISDAPSAVSIVTAQDIRDYGYRTLTDILNSMRGLYVTLSLDYDYLGGRGFGAPGDYAGRIMLTIDDYVANENVYHQIFLGEDALLDVEMIERVEFIPGPGSTTYGNSAFLGVINIVTKRGRDFAGGQLAADFGDNGERRQRFSYGKYFENGAEFLLSASKYEDDGINVKFPELDGWEAYWGVPYDNQEIHPLKKRENRRLFVKGGYQGFTLEFATVRQTALDSAFLRVFEPIDLGIVSEQIDENSFASIKYDSDIGEYLKSSTHLYSGQNRFQYEVGGIDRAIVKSAGRWWGLDLKFVGTWFNDHKLLFGAEYRDDYQQEYSIKEDGYYYVDSYIDQFDTDMHTVSLYLQDEYTLTDQLTLTLGLRHDDNSVSGNLTSPRIAAIFSPWSSSIFKLSYGKAFRYASPWEEFLLDYQKIEPEKVSTTELVWQQQVTRRSRLTASVYRNRVSNVNPLFFYESLDTFGQEIGIEYVRGYGFRVHASIAHQESEDSLGQELVNSPRWLGKLNIAHPLLANRVMAGFEVQYVGRRLDNNGGTMKANTLANLTLSSRRILSHVNLSLTVHNLFDARQDHLIDSYPIETFPGDGRSFWLQLEYDLE